MKRATLAAAITVGAALASSGISAVAQPAAMAPGTVASGRSTAVHPAEVCLADVKAFNGQMQKDGYWMGASAYGYGYPMSGYGYGYNNGPAFNGNPNGEMTGYLNARPGYEIRTLLASATILAHAGQQQSCEDVLTSLRSVYKSYAADLHTNGMRQADEPGWAQRQISAALPVTRDGVGFRSDQLLDTDVRNPRDETLGSVHDIITDPKTGKIAYLILARGGIFGFGESFVPVPWGDFKAPPNVGLVVLDATKASIEAAPKVSSTGFSKPGQFEREGAVADAYWKTHLETKTAG